MRKKGERKEMVAGDGCLLEEMLGQAWDSVQPGYSIAHAVVKQGRETLSHKMVNSSEAYFILKGRGMMFVRKEEKEVHEGEIVYIAAGESQKIRNVGNGDLEFLCIVCPPWKKENEKVER